MSLISRSNWLSDLLCCETAEVFTDESPENSSKVELTEDIEEMIAGLIDDEGDYMPGFDYPEMFHSKMIDASARSDSVAWIVKVQEFYHFQPLTAYLSVNYMDRFLSSHFLPSMPQSEGWLMQLISVACLSLAAKMEEPLVPSLFDIQVEGAKFIFEPRTIRRMELLVLNALDWRLRSIAPFDFIDYFASKVDPTGTFTRFLVSRATQIILTITRDISFLEYKPSSIAASAMVCAANEIPNLSFTSPGNAAAWCIGLNEEIIVSCYRLMQEVVVDNCIPKTPRKEAPPLRVTSDLSSSCSSSPSSNKRRRLNNSSWTDQELDKL